MQRYREVNHAWVDTGAGWVWRGAIYTGGVGPHNGRLGLAMWSPTDRVDDFGGGPTCFIVGMNYRYAERHAHIHRIHVNPSDVRNV